MDARRFATGTVVGGIVLFVAGYVIFEIAFAGFYAANVGSASGVVRDPVIPWALAVASLSYAALVVFALGNQAAPLTIGRGALVGAIVGFLMWMTADFVIYGISNVATLARTIVDPLLELVHGGLGGASIAAVLQRNAPLRAQARASV